MHSIFLQNSTNGVGKTTQTKMRWFVLLALVLFVTKAKEVTKDVGNCGIGLSCNVFLRLQADANQVMLLGGFSVSGASIGTPVPVSTKESIAKNSAFKYYALGGELMTAMKQDLATDKCDERVDLVALALYDSATKVRQNCGTVNSPECSQELPVLSCGNPVSGAILPMPWESLLSPLSSTFDDDGSNFDIFSALIRGASMESLLVAAKDITLLVPNDEAFGRSARYMGSYRGDPSNETAVFETYKAMSKDGMTIDGVNMPGDELMKFFLAYHIVSDQHPGENFLGIPRSMKTASTVPILSIGTKEIIDISSATPNAKVLQTDLRIQRGVIVHSIDAVLLPFEVSVDRTSSFDCKVKKIAQFSGIMPNPSLEASVAPLGKALTSIAD